MIVVALVLSALHLGATIFMPLALSGFIALLMYPLANWLEVNGVPRVIAIILTFAIVVSALYLLGTLLYRQIASLIADLPNIAEKVEKAFNELEYWLYNNFKIKLYSGSKKSNMLQENLSRIASNSGVIVTSTVNILFTLVNYLGLVPIYIFLFLLYRTGFKEFLLRLAPRENHKNLKLTILQVQRVTQAYIQGLLTVMSIVAVINYIWLRIIGVDYAIFFAVLSALLLVFPYIGIALGSSLPALYGWFITGDYHIAIWVLLAFNFTQFVEGNFITPVITGNKVKVNALSAIIALIVWGWLWGIVGLILAIPVTAMLKVIFDSFPETRNFGYLLGNELYKSPVHAARNDGIVVRLLKRWGWMKRFK